MQIIASPVGEQYSAQHESDITELAYSGGLLNITVATTSTERDHVTLEVAFSGPRGFRVLDEGDLIRYWEAGMFRAGQHVYEITAGGWREQEIQLPGMLTISDAINIREWFVATTNTCASVLAAEPPRLVERAA